MQAYSDPTRADDPHALPDVEVFYVWDAAKRKSHNAYDRMWSDQFSEDDDELLEAGWYYWYCFPGCLPDSDPVGPFATEALALADAQQDAED